MNLLLQIVLFLSDFLIAGILTQHTYGAFDPILYEDLLNPKLCEEQLQYIVNDPVLVMDFIESGLRLPRSILTGNLLDLGNYERCLGIDVQKDYVTIQGKYCSINLPLKQSFEIQDILMSSQLTPLKLKLTEDMMTHLKEFYLKLSAVPDVGIRDLLAGKHDDLMLTLAVCVPKPCTTEQALSRLFANLTALGMPYKENYCRFKNDKPWVEVDYFVIVIISFIALLTTASTSCDLWYKFKHKSDLRFINPVYQSFSLYSNTCRLLTFASSPDALECVDGIRALTMAWVILGHCFVPIPFINYSEYLRLYNSALLTGAPVAVDTFFMLSGMLLVYTAAKKTSGIQLLKNLHVFYFHRVLRMWPLLAATILFYASFLHHLGDGPRWHVVAEQVNYCRKHWWPALFFMQNLRLEPKCASHSWYLTIDVQLHILSPLILFWVLSGKKKVAWTALFLGLMVILAGATIYNFLNKFPGALIAPARNDEKIFYLFGYYINTLARAPPFVVGMVFGYLLHLYRETSVQWSKITVVFMWICVTLLLAIALLSSYPMKDVNWDNQIIDSLVNSFSRAIWAVGLGCMIFACVKGYGGPINWLLSLYVWKLPSRLSYGMYLFHSGSMYIALGSMNAPIFFNVMYTLRDFICQAVIAFVVAFVMTLVIDSPFSALIKIGMDSGKVTAKGDAVKIKNKSFKSETDNTTRIIGSKIKMSSCERR